MSRFTLIILGEREKSSGCLISHYRDFRNYIEKILGSRCYFQLAHPRILLLLSNGLSKEEHYEIYSKLNEVFPSTSIISVLHEIPIFAIHKASKLSKLHEFFYEEGVEQEYLVGYFSLPANIGDIIGDIARRINIFHGITSLLVNTGSLPLQVDYSGVLAVLNRKSIKHLEYIKSQIHVKIVSSTSAIKAIEEAVENTST
ncbi:MAG: hypothetical protein QXJ69_03030 [Desulfurococcaceae archaeon]